MLGFFRKLLGQEDSHPTPVATYRPPVEASALRAQPTNMQTRRVTPPGKVLIPSETSDTVYEKDLSSPFWADVAKMQPGAFVKYESIDKEWHVFTVEDGPKYGRRGFQNGIGLSVVVRRVSTGKLFTMPPDRLRSCDRSFVARDGQKVRPGEGGWR